MKADSLTILCVTVIHNFFFSQYAHQSPLQFTFTQGLVNLPTLSSFISAFSYFICQMEIQVR